MSRLDLAIKLQRAVKFLIATQDPRIYTLLMRRGYSNERRREGWELLMKAGGHLVDMVAPTAADGTPADLVGDIDIFENEWYDVVDAALLRQYPDVHELIFKNLQKTSDSEVVLTTSTLLDRCDGLEKDTRGRDALALLAERGFTAQVRKQGRDLIERVTKATVAPLPTPDAAAEAERQKAEEDLWAYYLDWSKTARTVVRRKDLRIKMGISSPTRSAADEETPVEETPQVAYPSGAQEE